MDKPKFQGNPRNEADLLAFEQALRAWEEAKADAERYDELYKADEAGPSAELQQAIAEFLGDPGTQDRLRGPEGLPGMNGAPGSPGADGTIGADGAVWRDGTGAPGVGVGEIGDYYIDLEVSGKGEGDIYRKGGGGWTIQGNIKGSDWTVNPGAPLAVTTGDNPGDLYLDSTSGDVYQVNSAGTLWVNVANIMGPTGATGATGPGVPTGGTADQYLAKIDGTDFNTEWRGFNTQKVLYTLAGTGTPALTGTIPAPQHVDILGAILDTTGGDLTIAANEITVATGGGGGYMLYFMIDVDTNITVVGDSREQVFAGLQIDSGSGYIAAGPIAWLTHYGEDFNENTLSAQVPLILADGDKIRLVAGHAAGTDDLIIRERNTIIVIQKLAAIGGA